MKELDADELEIDPYYLYKMKNDFLKIKRQFMISKILRNEDEVVLRKRNTKITTAQDVKDLINRLNDSDDR